MAEQYDEMSMSRCDNHEVPTWHVACKKEVPAEDVPADVPIEDGIDAYVVAAVGDVVQTPDGKWNALSPDGSLVEADVSGVNAAAHALCRRFSDHIDNRIAGNE